MIEREKSYKVFGGNLTYTPYLGKELKKALFCVNGCTMSPTEKKSAVSRSRHPAICPNKPAKWKAIRAARIAREQEAAAGGGVVDVAGGGVVLAGGGGGGGVVRMSKKARRAAEKAYEKKSPQEKRPNDFVGDAGVVVLGSKKKAVKAN